MKASNVKREDGKLVYRGHEFPGFNKPVKAPAGDSHKKMVLAKKDRKSTRLNSSH